MGDIPDLTTAVLSNPVVGAVSMVVAIVLLNALKGWLPAFITAPLNAGGKVEPEPEPVRSWRAAAGDLADRADAISDHLKMQVEVLKRQTEAVERLERSIAILVAHERSQLARPRQGQPR